MIERHRRNDAGFTLPELLISIVILGIVVAVIANAFITSSKHTAVTSQRFNESHDAQIATAYFANDVQSAAAITASTCGIAGGMTNLVNFSYDGASTIASYFHGASGGESRVVRRFCDATGQSEDVLVHYAGGVPTVSCEGGCDPGTNPRPNKVEITIVEHNDVLGSNDYTFTLRGSRRIYAANAAPPAPGELPTLLALGGGNSLSSTGSSCLTVNGTVIVNSSAKPAATIQKTGCYAPSSMQIFGVGTCSGAGCGPYTNRTTPVPDPLAGLPVPGAGLTVYTDGDPSHGPGIYRTTPLTFPNGPTTLVPGIYVMEAGADFNNKADVQGNGVLLYNGCAAGFSCANNGQISITGNVETSLHLTPTTIEPYAGITIWQSAGNTQTVTLRGNGNISIGGILYLPNAQLSLGGDSGVPTVGKVIAKSVDLGGNTAAIVGA
jgi:prepilin-type N-terminal cleavage/methylation domain-containing protein